MYSKPMEDLTGKRYGRLVVLSFIRKREDKHFLWLCRCDCGNEKEITRNRLTCKKEPSRSCGCRQREIAKSKRKNPIGSEKSHWTWTAMKQRCFNSKCPEYKNYGARGITVCEKWMEFLGFWEDMGNPPEGLSLDRIDNDGNYEPGNCRWTTFKVQMLNRRETIKLTHNRETKPLLTWCNELGLNYSAALARWRATKNVKWTLSKSRTRRKTLLTHNGETHNLTEWSKIVGIALRTLFHRFFYAKWSVENTLTKPVQKH